MNTIPYLILLGNVLYVQIDSNLLKNGDFESLDFDGNWYCKGCNIASSSDVYSGTKSLHVIDRTADWSALAQDVTVENNKHYKMTAMIKLLSTKNDMMYQEISTLITCKDGSGTRQYTLFGKTPNVQPGMWYEVGGVSLVAGGTECYIYIKTLAPSEYIVDDAKLELLNDDHHWKATANKNIDQFRKADLTLRLTGSGSASATVQIELEQTRHEFFFGSAIYAPRFNKARETLYRQRFYENFEWGVLESKLKWLPMEPTQGSIDYDTPLRAINTLTSNGIKMRCHCLTCAKEEYIPSWVKQMNAHEIRNALNKRIRGVMDHTKGLCEHWDVNNENLHGDWFEQHTFDPDISMDMFRTAHNADPNVTLYVNEYGIVNYPEMAVAYKDLAVKYRDAGVPLSGIGVQAHFSHVDRLALQAQLDILAESGIPITITEMTIDAADENSRAHQLEQALYTMFSHPAVNGVLLWGFWDQQMFINTASLFDGHNLTANAAGRVYQNLYHNKWRTHITDTVIHGTAPFTFRAFKGGYKLNVYKDGQKILTTHFTLKDSGKDIRINIPGGSGDALVG